MLGVIISECLTGNGPFGISLNLDDESMGERISNELNRIKSGETNYLVNKDEVDGAEIASTCSNKSQDIEVESIMSSSNSNEFVEGGFSDSSDSMDHYSPLKVDASVMNTIGKNVNRKISKVRFSVQDDRVSIIMSETSQTSKHLSKSSSITSSLKRSATNLSLPPITTSNSQTSFSSYQSKKQLMEIFYACTKTDPAERPTLKWLLSELEDSVSSTVIDQWYVILSIL